MNVYTSVFRIIYNVFGQYLAVCRNNYHIGRDLIEQCGEFLTAQGFGLIDRDTLFKCVFLNGRRGEGVSSALRLIGLGDDSDNVFPALDECLERKISEIGCTHKKNLYILHY